MADNKFLIFLKLQISLIFSWLSLVITIFELYSCTLFGENNFSSFNAKIYVSLDQDLEHRPLSIKKCWIMLEPIEYTQQYYIYKQDVFYRLETFNSNNKTLSQDRWNYFSKDLLFYWLFSWQRNWVFATKSNFLILISLQPGGVNLYNIGMQRYNDYYKGNN